MYGLFYVVMSSLIVQILIGNLLMFNHMDLQTYMINDVFEGIETVFMDYTNRYDVLHRHFLVSRGYELIVYKIIGVTQNSTSVGMRYMMFCNSI